MSVTDGTQPTSQPARAYGPVEMSDDTRQAQNQVANDAPVDVNPNAIAAREQTSTLVLMGKNFEAGASRRNSLFDHFAAKMAST